MSMALNVINIFQLCVITVGILTQPLDNYCKLHGGSKGQCVNIEKCSLATQQTIQQQECENSTICCPIFEKIVTPELKCHKKCLQYYNSNYQHRSRWNFFHRMNRFPSYISFIIGGEKATLKEFPHMAALGFGDDNNIQWQCGGSLISERFILTAAHCVSSSEIGELKRVRLGSLNLFNTTDDEHVQEFSVTQIFRHPNYTQPVLYNDIALVILDRPVTFTEYVRPACLPTISYVPNTNLITTGWGRTQYFGSRSESLMKVSLDLFSNALCRQAYVSIPTRQLPGGINEDLQICAGDANEEKDACQGDSGGPLQIVDLHNPALYYIIGITSFGRGCGTSSNPGVYTRVSHYVAWIEGIVWPN